MARATAKKPLDRHRSAEAFLEELRHCFGDVIYGRDIDRFLKVRRQPTVLLWQTTPDTAAPAAGVPNTADQDTVGLERRLTPRGIQINAELQGLFNEAFEQPRPVTSSTLNEIRAITSRRAPSPDDPSANKDAVRAELHGLFNGEDE